MKQEEIQKIIETKLAEANLSQYIPQLVDIVAEVFQKGFDAGFDVGIKIANTRVICSSTSEAEILKGGDV